MKTPFTAAGWTHTPPPTPTPHTHTLLCCTTSVAWPRSGQVGSWETVPVALLTFFISERLKNIPDIFFSALLRFLNPSFFFFFLQFYILATGNSALILNHLL